MVWFRSEKPDWGISTEIVEINLEKQYAIFRATIFNEVGKVMATATKMENVRGFQDFIEKAETSSVGRALAMCGYGTQYEKSLDERGDPCDTPLGEGEYEEGGEAPRPQPKTVTAGPVLCDNHATCKGKVAGGFAAKRQQEGLPVLCPACMKAQGG
jgi:hypothetical protein